jgi:SAM-dependent methyltransferase
MSEGGRDDAAELRAPFTDATVRLLQHPSGGTAEISVDGETATVVDLFRPQGSLVLPVHVASDLPLDEHVIVVRPGAARNPSSGGSQIHLQEIVLSGPLSTTFPPPGELNYGNPYSPVLLRWMEVSPPTDLILEVGGGDRRRTEPNHVNFEYQTFEFADVYGDIHDLPFAEGAFGTVVSQAVFEHVRNPFRAAEELVRVTRPGGVIVTEVAFVQPLHAAPFHFFNMTPAGLAELFAGCETIESGWFGGLAGTVEWLMASAGLPDKVPPARLGRIVDEMRSLDRLISEEELKSVASGVYLVVRKPVDSGVS